MHDPLASAGSDLWAPSREKRLAAAEPLAARLRPRTLDEVVGQRHLLGPEGPLRRMVESDRLPSLLLAGPPGTGKTTIAEVIAHTTGRRFVRANAVTIGVKEIRGILEEATHLLGAEGRGTILFLDEIHRFSKAQQDVLLPDVERGRIVLVGATTENPFFAVNAALVSRSTVFRLESLGEDDVRALLDRALADAERGVRAQVDDDALAHLARVAGGDARRALAALEIAVALAATPDDGNGDAPPRVDRAIAEAAMQMRAPVHDGTGDDHYDLASALIKSMRGSDPDAALHWLARLLEAGEDPRFVARRIVILASEDVGLADPTALPVAMAAWHAVERVGMPEGRLHLAHAALHLALAPKSDAVIRAIDAAIADVRAGDLAPVPPHLRDRNTTAARVEHEGGGRGDGYRNPHRSGGWNDQRYVEPREDGRVRRYWEPGPSPREADLRRMLARRRGEEPPGGD